MRLKYFLRGLGAGIILGALVMLCSVLMSGSYRLSDKQIMERAEKLGMVSAEEAAEKTTSADTESISSEKASTTEKTTAQQSTEKTEKEESTTTSEAVAPSETPETTEATATEATTKETTAEASTTEASTTESTTEQTTEAATESAGADSKTKVKISVTPGMDSYTVAVLLQDAGIIKDAAEFDNYLNTNGYSTKIRVNEFTFTGGMSDKEIAEKLVSEGQ